MNFKFSSIELTFEHKLIYLLNHVEYSEIMHFDQENKWDNACFEVTRIVKYHEENPAILDIRFDIRNKSKDAIFLKECVLVEMQDSHMLQLANEDYKNYQFFRQGRHKNDLPGVCTLGKFDQRFQDACGGMLESGSGLDQASQTKRLVSDQMTILYASDDVNILFGYLTSRDQFFETSLELSEDGEWVNFSSKTIFNCNIQPDQCVMSELLRIDLSSDVIEKIDRFAKVKAKMYDARKRKTAPSVFCTWYYYGLTVTYQDVEENLKEMCKMQLPFDVFQIDEGWEITLGEWEPNEKFPKPMSEIANEIIDAGYIPGIWTSPFVAKETCTVWKEHPEWILKDRNDNPCIFPMNDTTYYVFDITNPATYDYFHHLYHKLRFEWGYVYHKLDFTRAAVIYPDADFYDKDVTLVQAYFRAVNSIRSGMGDDAYFLMCGGLYDPLIGIVDAQRVGSDVLSMWSSNIDTGGKTAPYTIKQNLLRYYMNHWWDNDPDALMVRRNEVMERDSRLTYGLLNEEEVKTSTLNQLIGGGLVCSTEPLAKIDHDRLYQLKHILPTVPLKATPIDLFDDNRYPAIVNLSLKNQDYSIVTMINWEDEISIPASVAIDEKHVGKHLGNLSEMSEYIVCEFYSGQYKTNVKYGDIVTFGEIAPHGSAVFKIAKMENEKPTIVASNAHYSMGGEVNILSIQEDKLYFEIHYLFQDSSNYKILLPEGIYFSDGTQLVDITIENKGLYHKEFAIVRKDK